VLRFGGVWLVSAFRLVAVLVLFVVLGLVFAVARSFGVGVVLLVRLLRIRLRSFGVLHRVLWVFLYFWDFFLEFFLDFACESV